MEYPYDYSGNGLLYAFTLDSLPAAELREIVSVQIFNGKEAVSSTMQYSADTYGNNKSGDLPELCKALFAYSDSAKAFFLGKIESYTNRNLRSFKVEGCGSV